MLSYTLTHVHTFSHTLTSNDPTYTYIHLYTHRNIYTHIKNVLCQWLLEKIPLLSRIYQTSKDTLINTSTYIQHLTLLLSTSSDKMSFTIVDWLENEHFREQFRENIILFKSIWFGGVVWYCILNRQKLTQTKAVIQRHG